MKEFYILEKSSSDNADKINGIYICDNKKKYADVSFENNIASIFFYKRNKKILFELEKYLSQNNLFYEIKETKKQHPIPQILSSRWEHTGYDGKMSAAIFNIYSPTLLIPVQYVSCDYCYFINNKMNYDYLFINQFNNEYDNYPEFRTAAIKKAIDKAKTLGKKYVIYEFKYNEEYHLDETDLLPFFNLGFKLINNDNDKIRKYLLELK